MKWNEIFALTPRTHTMTNCMHLIQSRRKTSRQTAFAHELVFSHSIMVEYSEIVRIDWYFAMSVKSTSMCHHYLLLLQQWLSFKCHDRRVLLLLSLMHRAMWQSPFLPKTYINCFELLSAVCLLLFNSSKLYNIPQHCRSLLWISVKHNTDRPTSGVAYGQKMMKSSHAGPKHQIWYMQSSGQYKHFWREVPEFKGQDQGQVKVRGQNWSSF